MNYPPRPRRAVSVLSSHPLVSPYDQGAERRPAKPRRQRKPSLLGRLIGLVRR